jgi:hypothetical protein
VVFSDSVASVSDDAGSEFVYRACTCASRDPFEDADVLYERRGATPTAGYGC